MRKLGLVLARDGRRVVERPVKSVRGHGKAAAVGIEQPFVPASRIRIGLVAHNVKRDSLPYIFRLERDVVVLGTAKFVQPQGGLFPMFLVIGDRIVRMPAELPPFPQFLLRIPLRTGTALNPPIHKCIVHYHRLLTHTTARGDVPLLGDVSVF